MCLCACAWVLCVYVYVKIKGFSGLKTKLNNLPRLCLLQNNPADNLLNEDTFRKWSCANAGEKQASVVLQVTVLYMYVVSSSS